MSQENVLSLMGLLMHGIRKSGCDEKMCAMFEALVLASRSGKHIDRLHAALPDNCRLPRMEFSDLKKAVQLLVAKRSTATDAPSDDAILLRLAFIRQEATLEPYYISTLQYITFERIYNVRLPGDEAKYFHSQPGTNGYADPLCVTTWEGWKTYLTFSFTGDPVPKITVTISFQNSPKTEPFIHALRRKLAEKVWLFGGDTDLLRKGIFSLYYWLDDDDLSSHLMPVELDFPHPELGDDFRERKSTHLLTNAFLTEVRKRLAAAGIEFDEITPLVR